MKEPLKHASLFTGIGGFDLAAQWMGWDNVFQVEIDKWCRKILAKNFPNTRRYEDIKNFNAKKYEGSIDVISGGFPCQPFSVAGNRRGQEDDRYLWEEMLRIIREVKPTYVVGENVTGIIGMALDTVLLDLENEGYATETYIIPACAKNAWHRRDRVWIIAYADNGGNSRASRQDEGESGKEQLQKRNEMGKPCKSSSLLADAESWRGGESGNGEQAEGNESRDAAQSISCCSGGNVANSSCERCNDGSNNRQKRHFQDDEGITEENKSKREGWKSGSGEVGSVSSNADHAGFEKQRQRIADEADHLAPKCSSWWEAEPGVGRVVDGLPGRVDRIKGLGNAVVPQVVYEIFKAIELPYDMD